MVVNLEVPVFRRGVDSMQTEQTFVVTAQGSRPLVRQERDELTYLAFAPRVRL